MWALEVATYFQKLEFLLDQWKHFKRLLKPRFLVWLVESGGIDLIYTHK